MTGNSPPKLAEFVVIVALLMSVVAFSTDAMLPSFPQITADLHLENANQAQLVITVFILGTGIGQLFFGPLSDGLGRKPAIGAGLVVFTIGCLICLYADSLKWVLIGRLVQGLGVSAARTVTTALVRDLYEGRAMARVMSFAFGIFILVPAVAPSVGQLIMGAFGWRSIFVSFIIYATFTWGWMFLRLAETHPPERRFTLEPAAFISAVKEVLTNRTVFTFIVIQGLLLGGLFAYLSSTQQIFVDSFGVGDKFPLYFALIALASALASFINGTLVMRIGMRRMCEISFGLAAISAGLSLLFQSIAPNTWLLVGFTLWSALGFLFMGISLGNVNALAMETMGHISGLAAAIIGSVSTLIAVVLAIPIGLAFNGTPIPLITANMALYTLAFVLMIRENAA
ncbi:MAG: multidrug effflux MFS transporter [Paracoccaceae bacterium]